MMQDVVEIDTRLQDMIFSDSMLLHFLNNKKKSFSNIFCFVTIVGSVPHVHLLNNIVSTSVTYRIQDLYRILQDFCGPWCEMRTYAIGCMQ